MRLLQGIGASGGIVISRSVAADTFSGRDLAKAMAVIGAINGIAPVASPVVGGFLSTRLAGAASLFCCLPWESCCFFCECAFSRNAFARTQDSRWRAPDVLEFWGKCCAIRDMCFSCFNSGLPTASFFGNIASSPFIMQSHYGFFGACVQRVFAINSVAIGVAAALSVKFRHTEYGTLTGSVGMLIVSLAEFFVLWSDGPFWLYESLLFCCCSRWD